MQRQKQRNPPNEPGSVFYEDGLQHSDGDKRQSVIILAVGLIYTMRKVQRAVRLKMSGSTSGFSEVDGAHWRRS
jgi:hypothetical protein